MTDYDVIICGLGPVGQLLALLLGDRGVRTLALDREHEPYLLPRAAVIDDKVLRIFQSVGLDEAVLADSQVQPGASIITASGLAGFGVPLLEAMKFDLPVVAYDAAAIGETVGDAGVLLHERDLAQAAEAAALVSEDTALRAKLAAAGRNRVADFDTEKVAQQTREVLGL